MEGHPADSTHARCCWRTPALATPSDNRRPLHTITVMGPSSHIGIVRSEHDDSAG